MLSYRVNQSKTQLFDRSTRLYEVMLYVPSNNFSVTSGRFPMWNQCQAMRISMTSETRLRANGMFIRGTFFMFVER